MSSILPQFLPPLNPNTLFLPSLIDSGLSGCIKCENTQVIAAGGPEDWKKDYISNAKLMYTSFLHLTVVVVVVFD